MPPALFPALLAEAARQDAERRYLALLDRGYLGESSFGVTNRWKGSGKKPESDWDYDHSGQQAYFAELRRQAGLSSPQTEEDAQAADNAAWASLRQARRIRA